MVMEMINYDKGKKIEYFNLVRYRNWISQESLGELYSELNRIILGNKAKKCGPLISCTHIVRKKGETLELDFEIMVPIDKEIALPIGFCMCNKFSIENAIDIHIITNEYLLEEETEKVKRYIKEKNILPKTATYCVLEKEENGEIDTHLIFGL